MAELTAFQEKHTFVKWVKSLESDCSKQFEVDKETPGFIVELLFAKQECRMSSKKAFLSLEKKKINDNIAHIPIRCLVF